MTDKDLKFEALLAEVLQEQREPSARLKQKIIFAITWRSFLAVRRRVIVFSFLLAVSLPLLFLAMRDFGEQAGRLGTLKILSLIFTDSEIILANWREFSLSFLESLPVGSMILVLAGIFVFALSLKFVFDNLSKIKWHLVFKRNYFLN